MSRKSPTSGAKAAEGGAYDDRIESQDSQVIMELMRAQHGVGEVSGHLGRPSRGLTEPPTGSRGGSNVCSVTMIPHARALLRHSPSGQVVNAPDLGIPGRHGTAASIAIDQGILDVCCHSGLPRLATECFAQEQQ